ncbi:MAG: UDP-glucose 4-epimerase GalE, partial [Methylophaga sp.]|nr:UDP-glucose 4-epimerase GalE [Methylophaga sp.]
MAVCQPENQKMLVLGGAGYIGSHLCKLLARSGFTVVVFDNLSTGHAAAVQWGQLVEGDILNADDLARVFAEQGPFAGVFHFCAKSVVADSSRQPDDYYRNNLIGTLNVLDRMVLTGHQKLVFSSSAAVYGAAAGKPIKESQAQQPINPYGQSKKMVEQILQDYQQAFGLNSASLRYFNACGADVDAEIGERHVCETHLIPNILKSLLTDSPLKLKIFGDAYPTPDGTCVRDYVHVTDLVAAHLLAFEYL